MKQLAKDMTVELKTTDATYSKARVLQFGKQYITLQYGKDRTIEKVPRSRIIKIREII